MPYKPSRSQTFGSDWSNTDSNDPQSRTSPTPVGTAAVLTTPTAPPTTTRGDVTLDTTTTQPQTGIIDHQVTNFLERPAVIGTDMTLIMGNVNATPSLNIDGHEHNENSTTSAIDNHNQRSPEWILSQETIHDNIMDTSDIGKPPKSSKDVDNVNTTTTTTSDDMTKTLSFQKDQLQLVSTSPDSNDPFTDDNMGTMKIVSGDNWITTKPTHGNITIPTTSAKPSFIDSLNGNEAVHHIHLQQHFHHDDGGGPGITRITTALMRGGRTRYGDEHIIVCLAVVVGGWILLVNFGVVPKLGNADRVWRLTKGWFYVPARATPAPAIQDGNSDANSTFVSGAGGNGTNSSGDGGIYMDNNRQVVLGFSTEGVTSINKKGAIEIKTA
ncbi:hypothetical protein HDU76_001016 [Blyttiomyces sp. JEL0837]|nr:hypothetical protein HDU76_001016 [Blyttiomyces sp. JEL0837]